MALVRDKRAFAEDCVRADILMSRLQALPGCAAATIIPHCFLAKHGATALRLYERKPILATARRPKQYPPWREPATAQAGMLPAESRSMLAGASAWPRRPIATMTDAPLQ